MTKDEYVLRTYRIPHGRGCLRNGRMYFVMKGLMPEIEIPRCTDNRKAAFVLKQSPVPFGRGGKSPLPLLLHFICIITLWNILSTFMYTVYLVQSLLLHLSLVLYPSQWNFFLSKSNPIRSIFKLI